MFILKKLLFKQIDSITVAQWQTAATTAYQWSKYIETMLINGVSNGDVTMDRYLQQKIITLILDYVYWYNY